MYSAFTKWCMIYIGKNLVQSALFFYIISPCQEKTARKTIHSRTFVINISEHIHWVKQIKWMLWMNDFFRYSFGLKSLIMPIICSIQFTWYAAKNFAYTSVFRTQFSIPEISVRNFWKQPTTTTNPGSSPTRQDDEDQHLYVLSIDCHRDSAQLSTRFCQ